MNVHITHTQVRMHARHTHTHTHTAHNTHTRWGTENCTIHLSTRFFICGALQKCIFLCLYVVNFLKGMFIQTPFEFRRGPRKRARTRSRICVFKERLFSSKRVKSLYGAFNLIVILLPTRYVFLTAQQHGEDKGQSKEYDSQNDTSSGASIHPPPSLSSAPISKLLANQQTIKWYQIAKFGSPVNRL